MKKLLLSGFLVMALSATVIAQNTGYDPVNSPFGHGEDSVKCRMNLSLMSTSAKAEDYKGALTPWLEVYKKCPASSKNIYIYGPRIFKNLFASETDAAKKKQLIDQNLEIYDTRLKYFNEGNKSTIVTYKTYDYMEMMGDKADSKVIYKWLGDAINDSKENMEPKDAYSYFMVASLNEFIKDSSKKDQYISDYFKISGYVEQAIAKAKESDDKASADYLVLVKDGIFKGFVASGAGDCKTLTTYYADKLDANKADKAFLTEVVNSLNSVGCNETDMYFTAAEYLYHIEPTASAALGLANKSLKDKDYDTAIKYYREAAKMETDKERASSYLLQLAGIFSSQRNFAKAKQVALDALGYNPNNGQAYIIIGQLYAASAGNIFPEAEKRGLVFCAAVDKMQRAKSVDPSVASEANKYINQYSAYYMDTESAFMMGFKPGESVFIPGWIGENTTVRLK